MNAGFNIHPTAVREFNDIVRYFAAIDANEADESLALAFDAIFNRHLDSIIKNPLLYNLRRGPTRRVNLKPRFGAYYISYMMWKDKVTILAVAHAKRRPYYWRKRIGEAKKMF